MNKNLLKKYGLEKKDKPSEEGGQVSGETGISARPKDKPAGRRAMTEQRKDMIKGGIIISLRCQGALQLTHLFMTHFPFLDPLGGGQFSFSVMVCYIVM